MLSKIYWRFTEGFDTRVLKDAKALACTPPARQVTRRVRHEKETDE